MALRWDGPRRKTASEEDRETIQRLERRVAYYRAAFERITEPVVFDEATFKAAGRVLYARLDIAQRALRHQPLSDDRSQVAVEPDTSVEGQQQGGGAPEPAEASAPESQGVEGSH